MTISIQKVPYTTELSRLANSTKHSLKITSPYITFKGIEYIKNTDVKPKIITRVTASNLSSNALDGKALKHLLVLGAEIRSIPNLHAKLYLIDDNHGIITSSNLTASGFSKNVELGVYFSDEKELFKSVDNFFSRLWEKAHPVTLKSLDQLEQQLKITKFNKGIYRLETEKEEEDIIPVPAIGNLVFNVEDEEEYIEKNIIEEFDTQEPDEIGDFFAPLPLTANSLIKNLSSSDEKIVQSVINSLALTSNEDFVNWLEKLDSSSVLVSIKNSYPYKRHVIKRMINQGTVSQLLRVIESLVTDVSNESQIIIYFDLIIERIKTFSINEKKSFIERIAHIKEYLLRNSNVGILEGKKNFAKPNTDRINRLINLCEGEKQGKEVQPKQINSSEDTIPSFQNIKRERETLGDDFWDYSVQFFPKIASGQWNNHLPAINSIFKELGKIHLKPDQKRELTTFAKETIKQVQISTKKVLKEVEGYLTDLSVKEKFNELEKEQLFKAINELEKSTGRLVQIYGQWTKSNRIERDIEFKKKMDYLTTSYSTQKTIKQYVK
ncbi:phospholipase D family protein [Peribacillus frigoritolerans]|uniref:phospholipase D family protein n=1 Tax=Peribacillus frigoritolerans TaxID=450367 RepID=UPI002B246C15|nr:phospholipase D family protein [Peribacillus frigoritolerans]MEB2492940.1 phospholipase D family protein [Peribacillus frigoritolerans]